jgi:transposase
MVPIDEAVAAYDAQEIGEKLSYRQVAKMFGVSVTTLRRRQQGS